jgi:acyl-CoA thioesterase-1
VDDALPAQLQRRLRERHPHARVIGAGVSGATSGDVLRRVPAMLERAGALDLALVQVGPNDVLRGVAPDVVRANLARVVAAFAGRGVAVLLTRVDPPAMLRARAEPYRAIHADLARDHGIGLVSFFPPGVLGHPEMVLADRVHPNARAIAAVAAHLLPAVEHALAQSRTGAGVAASGEGFPSGAELR